MPLIEADRDAPLIDVPLIEAALTDLPLIEAAFMDVPLIEVAFTDVPLIEAASLDADFTYAPLIDARPLELTVRNALGEATIPSRERSFRYRYSK